MRQQFLVALAVVVSVTFVHTAQANIIVTLTPRDADGTPVQGSVVSGSQVLVDVLLSVDAADDPLENVRDVAFDLAGTSPGVQVDQFTWSLDSIESDSLYTLTNDLSTPTAEYRGLNRTLNRIVDLSTVPVRVAMIETTVNNSGVLSVVDPNNTSATAARILADFATGVEFSVANANLVGGSVAFFVADAPGPDQGGTAGDGSGGALDGGGTAGDGGSSGTGGTSGGDQTAPVDTDGDGVPDATDAFPLDPTETLDTDGDGVGNNADMDDDGDGVPDAMDAFPLDPTETVDTDGDGVGDNADMFPTDPSRSADPSNNGNLGPRVTGGLCGMGLIGAMCFNLVGIAIFGLVRRRSERSSRF